MENAFYQQFMAKHAPKNRCFLCGVLLQGGKTEEHVFAKWLQHKYHLWDKEYPLANGTTIPFRQIKIQCCATCNNIHLKCVEDTIKSASEQGYQAFLSLDELVIYQWLAKIFYGLLYRKLTLYIDRKQPEIGFMTVPELLKIFGNVHDFLQSVRVPVTFHGFTPWSLFIVETVAKGDDSDFSCSITWDAGNAFTIGVRLGSVGLIACVEDYGYNKNHLSDIVAELQGMKLQPIQFDELYARITYKSSLDNRPRYYVMYLPNGDGFEVSLAYDDDQVVPETSYREWDNKAFAALLCIMWQKYGAKYEEIYLAHNYVFSTIYNPDGTLIEMI